MAGTKTRKEKGVPQAAPRPRTKRTKKAEALADVNLPSSLPANDTTAPPASDSLTPGQVALIDWLIEQELAAWFSR